MTASPYPALLAPFTLAGKRLRNRLIHASMTTRLIENAGVTERLIQHHVSRARGGVAMIVTEPLSMAVHQKMSGRVRVWSDENLDGLKRWAEAIEREDCRLLGQMQDAGRGRHVGGRSTDAIGPSVLPDDLSWTVPHALRVPEIQRLVEEFSQSAARIQRCGFSGVELSCGHGHLFHQFLSPWSNTRTDQYGGDVAGRARFVAELVNAVRAECGRDFIVGLKLPGDDGVAAGIPPGEAARIAAHLTQSVAVDYVCFAQGSHGRALEMHIPDDYEPRAPYLPLMRELRKSIPGVPVAALGRITDPAEADAILARGDAELISLGRALFADPAWLKKAQEGRVNDIRYCVSHNSCWSTGRPVSCDNNPRAGKADEVDWWPSPAPLARRVVVVGAGISGMEAAWVAAARGHHVTAFGRSREVGGKTLLRSRYTGGESFTSIFNYQLAAAQKAGTTLELGVDAGMDEITALRPDVVVLACGSTMIAPRWLPDDVREAGLVPDLRTAMAQLVRHTARQRGAAVIFDMDHTEGTYGAAEFLRERFDRVVVVTPRPAIAQEVPLVTGQGILRRFAAKGIETVVLAEPRWSESFEEGNLEYANVYTGQVGVIEDVAFFAYSTPRAADDQLAEPLRAAGFEVHLIGDCRSPRNTMAATSEGHAIGNAL